MAWITPIVNWIASNVLTPTDLNRIEGNTQDLKDNKVDKVAGKGLSSEDYTTVEKNKLSGIEAGAEVNVVTSVAGKTGDVVVSKADVGLGSVQNHDIATQAEAQAGTSNAKYMTPLRVREGVAPLVNIYSELGDDIVVPTEPLIRPTSQRVRRPFLLNRPGFYRFTGQVRNVGSEPNYDYKVFVSIRSFGQDTSDGYKISNEFTSNSMSYVSFTIDTYIPYYPSYEIVFNAVTTGRSSVRPEVKDLTVKGNITNTPPDIVMGGYTGNSGS